VAWADLKVGPYIILVKVGPYIILVKVGPYVRFSVSVPD
jgi:hypothetical protein